MREVLILNGPNLNLLGTREPEVYGNVSLNDIADACKEFGSEHGLAVDFRQSNSEHEIVEWLQQAAGQGTAVILNPAAFTHYSVAIRDAAAMLTGPLIEVHLSNTLRREEFRHTSLISGIATGTIAGFGVHSYLLALQALLDL